MLRVRQFDEIACNHIAVVQDDDLGALRFIIGHEAKPWKSRTAIAGDAANVLGFFKVRCAVGLAKKFSGNLPGRRILCIGGEWGYGKKADVDRKPPIDQRMFHGATSGWFLDRVMPLFVMGDKGRLDRLELIVDILNLLDESFPALVVAAAQNMRTILSGPVV